MEIPKIASDDRIANKLLAIFFAAFSSIDLLSYELSIQRRPGQSPAGLEHTNIENDR